MAIKKKKCPKTYSAARFVSDTRLDGDTVRPGYERETVLGRSVNVVLEAVRERNAEPLQQSDGEQENDHAAQSVSDTHPTP